MLAVTHAHNIVDVLTFGFRVHLPFAYQYVWGYSLINLCSAALVFHLIHTPKPARAFQSRALVYVGKISYGVYIWHLLVLKGFRHLWPAWELHRLSPHGLAFLAAYYGCTLLLASLSYYGFERGFLRFKDRITPEPKVSIAPTDA